MSINVKDHNTINLVLENYSDMVYRIAYQQVQNHFEAEDITQEVFLSLIEKATFHDEKHLKAWLIRVTVNKCHDYHKSLKRKEIPLDKIAYLPMKPKETEEMEILFTLPELDRMIIYLHYYERYTAKEIGKIFKKSENSIFIRLSRIREKLKAVLEEEKNEK